MMNIISAGVMGRYYIIYYQVLLICLPFTGIARHQQAREDSIQIADYINLSDDHIWQKNFDSARYYCDKAFELLEGTNYDLLFIYANNAMGQVLSRTGENDEAINYYLTAIEMAEAREDSIYMSAAARIFGNIGGVYYYLNDFEKALEYATRGYEVSQKAKIDEARGMFQMQIGISHMELGNYEEARPLLLEGVNFYSQYFNPYNLEIGLVNLGKLYYEMSRYSESRGTLLSAIQLNDTIEAMADNSHAHLLIALVALKRNAFNESEAFAEKALAISQKLNQPTEELEAYDALYSIYLEQNDAVNALKFRNRYFALNDSIRSSETVEKIADLETKYETEKKERQIQEARSEIERTNRLQTFLLTIIGIIVVFSLVSFLLIRQRFRLKKQLLFQEIDNLRLQINTLVGKERGSNVELDLENINNKLNTPLSEREFEILEMALGENSNREIAEAVFVSINTVKFHLRNIYTKLGVTNRKEALEFVIRPT